MELSEIRSRRDGTVRRVAGSPVSAMHVAMMTRDKADLLANVQCLITEDPDAAKEVLQSAIEVLAASLLIHEGEHKQ